MEEDIKQLRKELEELKTAFYKDNFSSSKAERKDITFLGKVGFYGVTPVAQQSGQSYPSGGATVDSQARTAINNLIDAIRNIGITL